MNTLTEEKLNNRIRSFKLKRGYMVTFANNPGGRGYSRCFIADDADLEDSFPLLELVEGESPQEFECVCHSHKSLDSTIRGKI